MDFQGFRGDAPSARLLAQYCYRKSSVFGTLGNEANIIIQHYLVLVTFSLTPKYVTLNDHE